MRHQRLAHATLAIAAVFVVAAIAFAGAGVFFTAESPAVAGDPGPALAGEGAVHFEQRCGRCHDLGDLAAWARAHPDPAARGQWLDTVLHAHFPPPEQERAAIIGHIQRTIEDAGD
ncbi:hypothetical protein ACOPJQ_13165 [Luteimonas dalianensis]|uniref:hypothetical protein n=1 Tax=Luteimonas dalianensis TaxID=1148196 RepID=UPI003BF0C888